MKKMSALERIRNENIQRNNDLLKKLNLDMITTSIENDVKVKKEKSKRSPAKVSKPPPLPTRRSRRLTSTPESKKDEEKREEEAVRERERREQLQELRLTKITGEFTLLDLLTDKKLGNHKFELRVLNFDNQVKIEENNIVGPDEDIDQKDEELIKLLKGMGRKFSAGDFFTEIRNCGKNKSKSLKDKRNEFDKLSISKTLDPSKIKLTHQRITAIHFHPSETDCLITGGDTNGNFGIWAVDSMTEDSEPMITIIKPHGRTISKILDVPLNSAQLISSSYDGSARLLDIQKQTSSEILTLSGSEGITLGISDIDMTSSSNLLNLTSLDGHFYQHDIREKFTSVRRKGLLRLHDKKIGGFCVNPNTEYQIATASLDRSLRIWDLRNISNKNSWSELGETFLSPHLYGNYSSRLSVSIVDWNSNNHLVCNGYDDKINIFDFSGKREPYSNISTWAKSERPTKPGVSGKGELPNNFLPFNTIKHNCQSGRWVSILKARWQKRPTDSVQKFAIANMNRSIDIYDENGEIISRLHDEEVMTAVPAVVSFHPNQNWVVGGTSSGKVYLFN